MIVGQEITWAYMGNMLGKTDEPFGGEVVKPMWAVNNGPPLPWKIPDHVQLGITFGMVTNKWLHEHGTAIGSYLVIMGMGTVANYQGGVRFAHPIPIQPGTLLDIHLINNDPWQQWVGGIVQAVILGA